MPVNRNLWKTSARKGRGKAGDLDPVDLPTGLQTGLDALYGHYEKTFRLWQDAGLPVPPCFIIVCQNTSISKLVYDCLWGFYRTYDEATSKIKERRAASSCDAAFVRQESQSGIRAPSQAW